MALDSILPTVILSTPAKAPASSAGDGMAGGSGMTGSAGSSGTPDAAGMVGPSGSEANSHRTAANGHRSGDDSPGHSTTGSASSSSHTKSSDKRPTTRSSSGSGSSTAKAHGSASSRSKTNTAHASNQAQGTKGTAGARKAADAQQQNTPATFVQALAQLQADAAANTDAVDSTEVAAAAADNLTGTDGKPKAARQVQSDDATAAASLAFLPQSLAAVVAATQGRPVQTPQPAAGLMDSSGDTTDSADDSAGAVTATGSSLAGQTALANVAGGAADTNAATSDVISSLKTDSAAGGATAAGTSSTTDGTNAAAIAFQAHMSISSHFQAPATTAAQGNNVEAPVGTPAFNDELGGKITWMASQGQGLQSASLQLSPEHMGPVNVKISVQDGSASVSFNAAHADTRTALEQALPRLREMFASQGLTLTDASVSHQSPRGQPQKQTASSINAIGGVSGESNATSITSVVSARLGLVDTYA